MATLTIRNLPQDLIDRLKERAKQNGHSMEQEARNVLGQSMASRSDLLSQMRSLWTKIESPPSAAKVDEWIKNARRGRQ